MLINIILHATPENGRADRALKAMRLVIDSVAHNHRIMISNNASTDPEVLDFLKNEHDKGAVEVFTAPVNHHLVAALNFGLHSAREHEIVCTIEDDALIFYKDWADTMESILLNTPASGISFPPKSQHGREFDRVTYHVLPGYREVVLHWTNDKQVWNGCTAWHPRVRQTIGYFYFPHAYGAIDYLYCKRALLAGLEIATLEEYEIEEGGQPSETYQEWKLKTLDASWEDFKRLKHDYVRGKRPLYEPYEEHEWLSGVFEPPVLSV